MSVQEKDTRAGSLEMELQEIMDLNVEESDMVYSFTVDFTPYFTVICC